MSKHFIRNLNKQNQIRKKRAQKHDIMNHKV